MLDTRGAAGFTFGGIEPPPVAAWQNKGWQVVDQFERPLAGTGEPLPPWCDSPESRCERPVAELASPKGDMPKK